jgi:DNA invertase Pin-like site-specific DNA recombinase
LTWPRRLRRRPEAADAHEAPKRPAGDKLAQHLAPPTPRERAARPPSPAPSGSVYGYARVSTVMQADEGESLDVQRRQIAGYAQMNGLTVARTFVERGVSGSKPLADRPGAKLLTALEPGDVMITAKLDRMFRSALDALDVLSRLKARGVAPHMIDLGGDTTGNGVSKLVFTILSAVAEAERDRTRERITEVKRDQKQRGRFLGGVPPFGWRVGEAGELVPVPAQQKAIVRMRTLRAEGLAFRAIAARMKEAGFPVSHMTVRTCCAQRRIGA